MKMAMSLDYKPTRYEGKGFLRNLNIRIHIRGSAYLLIAGGLLALFAISAIDLLPKN